MLEDELEHGEVGLWQALQEFAQLKDLDAAIGKHWKGKERGHEGEDMKGKQDQIA